MSSSARISIVALGLLVACGGGEHEAEQPRLVGSSSSEPTGGELPPATNDEPAPPPEEPPTPTTKRTLNIEWQRQETGYWCGPAATRMVITARESTPPSQSSLATELGTDEEGTDHIGLVVDLLNARWKLTGASAYVVRELPDVPTEAQRIQLKKDLVTKISSGYGIVANVISGWRPPGYPEDGIWFHYVAVVGYDEDGDKVLIADPAAEGGQSTAFSKVPRTYWIRTEDLGTWIGGRGYSG